MSDPKTACRRPSARSAAPAGPGSPGQQAPGLPDQPKKVHRTALHWTAGVLVALLLAGGGTIAGMRLASHDSAASGGAVPGQAGPAASLQRDGALLNQTLSDASAPGALTAAGAACRIVPKRPSKSSPTNRSL